jgi:hypothetical protein
VSGRMPFFYVLGCTFAPVEHFREGPG